ncbi:MAG TPA: MlaD family protein [Bryobacteraceae bacterium]|nr:MlaD family protein [Bryobacteraceae bacterium]
MAELEIKPSRKMLSRIGMLISSAAVIVGVLVWLLTGGGIGLFAPKVDIKTYMPDATGLGVGAPVRLNGIPVGAVKRIAISHYLDMQRAVYVDLRVESKYLSRIPVDSQTSIGSDTLIGDQFVDIAPGKARRSVRGGGELRSEPADTAAEKADLIYSIQDSLRKIDDVLIEVSSPNTPLGHYVMGDKEYQSAIHTIEAFEASMRGLVARGTPAANAVFSTSLYSRWDKSFRGIDDTLAAIQRGEGTAGRLYTSDDQYNQILAKVRDLRKSIADFRAQMAKTGASLQNEDAYRNLTRMLANMDQSLAALNRGEGQFGQMLTSPQMYESLYGSLNNLDAFLKDFRSNPRKYLRAKVF